MADVHKQAPTISRSLPEYRSKWSYDIDSRYQEFCRLLFDCSRENVQSCQQGSESSVTGALAPFEQIIQILESTLSEALPNA